MRSRRKECPYERRSHRGHHRPAQRRQIDAVQPLHRAPGGDRGRPPGRDARPELRRGGLERAAVLAGGYGRSHPAGRGFFESGGPAPGRAGGHGERRGAVPRRRGAGRPPGRSRDRAVSAQVPASRDPRGQQGRPAPRGQSARRVLRARPGRPVPRVCGGGQELGRSARSRGRAAAACGCGDRGGGHRRGRGGASNVGKSSLVNRLLGSERLVVAAEPGTTRDAIDTPLRYGDRTLVFIDTAGLRKSSKVDDDIEFYSTLRTARAIERSDVCVLVVDAQDGMHVQDLKIANDAWERGAALIIAVNKVDLIEEKDTNTAVRGEREIKGRAPFLEFIPFIYVSAKTGQRTTKLLELILAVALERDKRIPTHEVNEVLEALVDRQQPPQPVGESVRLLYASQIGTAPPRFAIVSNRPEAIPEAYTRYLLNGFRAAWQFTGSPVGIKFRRKREQAAHR